MNKPLPATVRPVTISDHQRWAELFLAYIEFYEKDISDEALATVWAWIFDPGEPFWCDLAVTPSGKIIGLVQYQAMHRSLGGIMVCYLSDLYVDPDARGSGAGRALIDHVIEVARDKRLGDVRWLTHDQNTAARALYDSYTEASGFILYSVPV